MRNSEDNWKVKLFHHGKEINVTLDILIPCLEGQPCFTNGQLWAIIYEKAFAKLHGCYANLEKLSIPEVLYGLTGAPCVELKLTDFLQDMVQIGCYKGHIMIVGQKTEKYFVVSAITKDAIQLINLVNFEDLNMTFEQFFADFSTIFVCEIVDDFQHSHIECQKSNFTILKVPDLAKAGKLILSVHQKGNEMCRIILLLHNGGQYEYAKGNCGNC